jgi:formiminotetrahydrofolate cyclodeaminase
MRALAAPTIAPAGGSAVAIAGATGAALMEMAAGLTLARDRYAAMHAEAEEIRAEAKRLRTELLESASDDARACHALGEALELPDDTDLARQARAEAKRSALAEGALIQLEVVRRAAAVAALAERLTAIAPPSTVLDIATATYLATAAARSAYWAARSDLGRDSEVERDLWQQAETMQRRVLDQVVERIG